MAATDHDPEPAQLAKALVAFSVDGAFPEEGISTLVVNPSALPAAIQALGEAKATLQVGRPPFSEIGRPPTDR